MNRKDRMIQYFMSHRRVTNELISKIEEEHYAYKPTDTSMEAKALVSHMLISFYRFAKVAREGNPQFMSAVLDGEETSLSALAEKYTSETLHILESFSDEEFKKEIDMTSIFGVKLPASSLLQLAMDHEIHHKGSLFVYVREMGHTELPLFVKR